MQTFFGERDRPGRCAGVPRGLSPNAVFGETPNTAREMHALPSMVANYG